MKTIVHTSDHRTLSKMFKQSLHVDAGDYLINSNSNLSGHFKVSYTVTMQEHRDQPINLIGSTNQTLLRCDLWGKYSYWSLEILVTAKFIQIPYP